jgi:hypothetical protein
MAQLQPTDLKTLDYAFKGQPFCYVPAKDTIDIKTMDYSDKAQPFVSNYTTEAPSAYIPRVIIIT